MIVQSQIKALCTYGIVDNIKTQSAGRMALNKVTLVLPVVCYLMYHLTLPLATLAG